MSNDSVRRGWLNLAKNLLVCFAHILTISTGYETMS